MKILFVTNEIPYPPDNGVRIVSYNAMRLMKSAGHELGLAVLTEEIDDLSSRFETIKSFCNNQYTFIKELMPRNKWIVLFKALINNRIFPVQRYNDEVFRSKLKVLIDEFKPDVIHFDIITMLQYREIVPIGIGTIASINDSYALTLENLISSNKFTGLHLLYRKLQYFQIKLYEKFICEKFDAVHVMTKIDAEYLCMLNQKIYVSIIPNGVNSRLFEITNKTIRQFDIIFVAKLSGENLYSLKMFLDLAWPIIQANYPEIKLNIVGKVGIEASKLKSIYRHSKGVCFIGYVDKLEKAYEKCGIAIVPVNKNCGIINKTIEAMASGLAVVGFENSMMGLNGAVNNIHYVSVTDYKNIGNAVVNLLRNKDICNKIKSSAHSFAVDNYLWSSRLNDFDDMYGYAEMKAKADLL